MQHNARTGTDDTVRHTKKIYADSLTKLKKSERLWSAKKKFCRRLQPDGSEVQMLHNVFHSRNRNIPGYLSRDCRTWRCRFNDGDAAGLSTSLTVYAVSEHAPETRRLSGALLAVMLSARKPGSRMTHRCCRLSDSPGIMTADWNFSWESLFPLRSHSSDAGTCCSRGQGEMIFT